MSDSTRGGYLSVCPIHGKLLERAFDLCEGIQEWETPTGFENLLDHLRKYFEPIDVS